MATDNKQIVQIVNDAFSSGNIAAFLEYCAEDVRWTMAGKSATVGKEVLRQMMDDDNWHPPVINVRSTISEGNRAVCEGTMTMSSKKGEHFEGSFCDVYRIEDGKIRELFSYMVPHGQAPCPEA